MSFDNLLVQRESGVAVLTVQRPQRLNALDALTLGEIRHAVLDFQHDEKDEPFSAAEPQVPEAGHEQTGRADQNVIG